VLLELDGQLARGRGVSTDILEAHRPHEGDRCGRPCPTRVPPWNRLGYGKNAIEVIYFDVR
jgi:hypothetical protein